MHNETCRFFGYPEGGPAGDSDVGVVSRFLEDFEGGHSVCSSERLTR